MQRGLTDSERATARGILEQLRRIDSAVLPDLDPASVQEQQQANVDVWAWYLEWAQIARSVITRGDLLVRLGLRQLKRSKKGELIEDVEEEDELEPPAQPAAGQVVQPPPMV